jgi:tetratricopeptide (TPR) repeat protein
MRRLLSAGIAGTLAVGLLLGAAVVLGPHGPAGTNWRGARGSATVLAHSNGTTDTTDTAAALSGANLPAAIEALQRHLRAQPRDAAGWATLGLEYVERARLTADPTYYTKSAEVLNRSLQVSPSDNDAALAGLGALAAARHDFSTALGFADRALAVNPYSMRAHATRIDALVELGRYPEAMAAARRADETRPGIPISTRLAYVLELRGQTARAKQVLERTLADASDPSDLAYVATQLGELAWNRGDDREASARFATALRADPSYLPALDGRARVRAALGDLTGAITDHERVASVLPLPGYLTELGDLYQAERKPDKALGQYRVVDAWVRIAKASGVATDLETALFEADHGNRVAALRAARAERARRASVHVDDALAWALHVNGRDREALGYARQAARSGYRNALFLYHRGMIERSLDLRDAAGISLSSALHLNPRFSPLLAPRARAALSALTDTGGRR